MVESVAREVLLNDKELMQSLMGLMMDKEYSLAKYASELMKNMSQYFAKFKLDGESIDLDKLYESLVRIDQSEDIFFYNLETIYNVLHCGPINEHVVADFIRRGFIG